MADKLSLKSAVAEFALLTYDCTEADLERAWVWGSYEEGIRFAFFRAYEELRKLAGELEAARVAAKKPLTLAQRALAQYHSAYRDLEAILLGVSEEQFGQIPSEGQWSLRKILLHIIEADHGFFFVIKRALDGARGNGHTVFELSDEGWEAFWAGNPFEKQPSVLQDSGQSSEVLHYYEEHHTRVLHEFANITRAEMMMPSEYWEDEPMSLQFRLQRFDAHLRQHSIQAQKALVTMGVETGEARRLLRLVYNALAEVEGALIGAWDIGSERCQTLANEISERTKEIKTLL